MAVTFHPVIPAWLIAAIATALLVLLAQGSMVLWRKKVPGRWIFYLAVLRVIATGLFAVCLLRPLFAYVTREQVRNDLLLLYDTSASMGATEDGGMTRIDLAINAMHESGLAQKLTDDFDVHRFAFARTARPIPADGDERLEPTGDQTDLVQAMGAARDYHRQLAGPVAAQPCMVLVTDGNDRSGADTIAAAGQLGARVFAIKLADDPPVDTSARVTIAGVQSAKRVLIGSECRFRAMIVQQYAAGTPVVLELTEDDRSVLEHRLKFNADRSEHKIDLAYHPTTAGLKRYTLRLKSSDPAAVVDVGDPYELTVDVVKRNNNILLFEDSWRWGFKFLRRVIESDPSFSFTAFLSRGSGTYLQFAEPDRTVRLAGFPQSQGELERFDILILGDVRPQRWHPAMAQAIARLVVERGKSLIVLAGPNLARWNKSPQLEALLPVVLSPKTATPIAGPLTVLPSAAGAASSFLYNPPDSADAARWQQLPPVDQIYPPLRKRPAATILLETPDHSNNFGPIIVMAEHTVGRGRVLFIGTDTLWKWQTMGETDESGQTPYQVFWQQALRAMAPRRWQDTDMSLWLETGRSRYTAGQTVTLTAEPQGATIPQSARIEATVMMPDGRKLPLMMSSSPSEAGRFEGSFDVAAPGHYAIAATLRGEGKMLVEVATAIDVDAAPDEMSNRRVNTQLLQRIATTTGGAIVDPAKPTTWPTPDSQHRPPVRVAQTFDPWNSFALLIVLVAVLAFDWLLRLLRGFV